MEQIIQQYIQAKGLNEQQVQQLIQELQQLDEQQLQQVVANMQQQLGGDLEEQPTQEGVEMMQHGGKKTYEQWKQSLPNNLKNTDTTLYNLKGAYEAGLVPEMTEDGFYHLGSRNPKTGELLKYPKHPTFNKMIEGEKKAGYEVFEKNGKLYSRPKLKQQYGGIPVSMDGLYEYENTPVIVPNGNITMEGIDYPVDAYNADTGEFLETMYPDEDYNFDANNVLEIPKGKFGISKMKNGGKVKLKKNAEGVFIGNDGNKYGYDESRNQFYKINTFTKEIVPNKDIEVEDFNLTDAEKNKLLKNNLPEVIVKSRRSNSPNYFQPFNNIPLTSQLNFNSQGYKSVDNKKQKPSTKKDEYSFVSDLSKMSEKSRKDNIAAYKSWTEEWNRVIPNFKSLPYNKQQEAVLNWMKKNPSGLNYDNVIQQLKNWGYTQNPESLLKDGKFAEGTNLMRPSNLIGKEDPLPLVEDVVFPNANTNQQSSVQEIPEVALPKEEGVDTDDLDIQDVFLGKLDNRNYTGQFLKNALLKTMDTQPSYFGRVDLKTPSKIQKSLLPYLNPLYSAFNAQNQEIDENSSVGQLISIQNKANLFNTLGKVVSDVTNENLQLDKLYEDSLANIYNQQQQIDDQNRRLFVDDTMRTRANQQNMQLEFQKQLAEEMNRNVNRKNFFTLSNLLHPDIMFIPSKDNKSTDVIRKNKPFKADLDYYIEEMEKLKKENEKLKTKVAKYGIRKK